VCGFVIHKSTAHATFIVSWLWQWPVKYILLHYTYFENIITCKVRLGSGLGSSLSPCLKRSGWRRSVVVSALISINVVNRHWARLLLGWVTACGQINMVWMCKQPSRSTQSSTLCGYHYWQQNMIIAGSEHCEHAHVTRMSAGLVLLTLKFQFSTHINKFELTGDPFKFVKLYNFCSLL